MSDYSIVEYEEIHMEALIDIIGELIPKYFGIHERNDYIEYLEDELEDYFVVLSGEDVIGAAGINYSIHEQMARLSWDLVDPVYHGEGIGCELMVHRLGKILKQAEIHVIEIRTSQLAQGFYAKFGFSEVEYKADYWSSGIDLLRMEMTRDQAIAWMNENGHSF